MKPGWLEKQLAYGPSAKAAEDLAAHRPIGIGMNDVINAKRIYATVRARVIGIRRRLRDTPEWL